MICQPCATAADYKLLSDETWCAACKRRMPTYPGSFNKIMQHRTTNPTGSGPRVKCPGSGKAPLVIGHDACTGCDCQHRPVGTRQKGTQ